MNTEIINVVEYPEDNFAIIEDGEGKFVMTKESPELIPIVFPKCYITDINAHRDRIAMLT